MNDNSTIVKNSVFIRRAFLLSFCNLPNYTQNNKDEAAIYEFTGDFQKDVKTLNKIKLIISSDFVGKLKY